MLLEALPFSAGSADFAGSTGESGDRRATSCRWTQCCSIATTCPAKAAFRRALMGEETRPSKPSTHACVCPCGGSESGSVPLVTTRCRTLASSSWCCTSTSPPGAHDEQAKLSRDVLRKARATRVHSCCEVKSSTGGSQVAQNDAAPLSATATAALPFAGGASMVKVRSDTGRSVLSTQVASSVPSRENKVLLNSSTVEVEQVAISDACPGAWAEAVSNAAPSAAPRSSQQVSLVAGR
mmetsp:Transcript_6829/g.15001  ORF Transcript_6829/g.15001 Transcript_6829/m.15001 type:complete len:238 (-) Transcript_6829:5-718(-)